MMKDKPIEIYDYFNYETKKDGGIKIVGVPLKVSYEVDYNMIFLQAPSKIISLETSQLKKLRDAVESFMYLTHDTVVHDPARLIHIRKGPEPSKLHYLFFPTETLYIRRREAMHFVDACHDITRRERM